MGRGLWYPTLFGDSSMSGEGELLAELEKRSKFKPPLPFMESYYIVDAVLDEIVGIVASAQDISEVVVEFERIFGDDWLLYPNKAIRGWLFNERWSKYGLKDDCTLHGRQI
jgi:hypothetical protein